MNTNTHWENVELWDGPCSTFLHSFVLKMITDVPKFATFCIDTKCPFRQIKKQTTTNRTHKLPAFTGHTSLKHFVFKCYTSMRDEDHDPFRVSNLDGEDSFFSYPIVLMTLYSFRRLGAMISCSEAFSWQGKHSSMEPKSQQNQSGLFLDKPNSRSKWPCQSCRSR